LHLVKKPSKFDHELTISQRSYLVDSRSISLLFTTRERDRDVSSNDILWGLSLVASVPLVGSLVFLTSFSF